jgi:ubiquinone/menaquinone biosynthesis C-methylase UbiE
MNKQLPHIETGRPARPGQLILERRYRIFRDYLVKLQPESTLIDIGCGNGAQSDFFIPHCEMVVGCDLIHLSETENRLEKKKFSFIQGSALELPFESNSVDMVTAFEVLEHVPSEILALSEINRILKPKGLFLITVPNKWWIFETHGAVVPGFNWVPWNRVPLVSWLPELIHDNLARARIYTAKNLKRKLTEHQFEVLRTGYVTAPMDVLPDGMLRRILRSLVFKGDHTNNPFLSVNLFAVAQKAY